jgi:hypothetical protein
MSGYEKRKENVLNEARLHFLKTFSMLIYDFISFPPHFYGEIFAVRCIHCVQLFWWASRTTNLGYILYRYEIVLNSCLTFVHVQEFKVM